MTFLELAEKILRETQRAMTPEEIWEFAKEKGYANEVGSQGKTPWRSIGAQIYVSIRDNPNSPFKKTGKRPVRFSLKEFSNELITPDIEVSVSKKIPYKERDLHAFLTYYLYSFHTIYTKTIYHEGSSKNRYAQWLHPDMVGVYFPLDSWEPEVLDISREIGSFGLKLSSYEIKRELAFSNLRESFFQAVSNSSWAHQGYLVAAEISQDSDFLQELKRLSNSFGIGIIKLDVHNPDDSEIIAPAKEKDFVEMDTMNRLAETNPDFKEFLKRIRLDLSSREIRKERYDQVFNTEDLIRSINRSGEQHG